MKKKKNLCGESFLKISKKSFQIVPDTRKSSSISLVDALMSGLAVFKLKMPSLLKFEEFKAEDHHLQNIKNIFSISNVPSDTQLREILDPVPYYELFQPFKDIFRVVQGEKALNQFKYQIPGNEDVYLVSNDGTGFFSSSKIKCNHCLVKKVKNKDEEDELMYHHQMLGSAIVHPGKKTVIPFAPEPIMNSDGQAKNDCERNSAKRLFYRLKDDHPGLNFCILGDSLFTTVPNFNIIHSHKWQAILGIKPGSHKTIFDQFNERPEEMNSIVVIDEIGEKVKKKRTRTYKYKNGLYLTLDSDVVVNVLDFEEVIEWNGKNGPEKKRVHFSWATTIEITDENIYQIMKAGRSRWKCENEVFNTLKNQGYHLEHNYGHGQENLSANFAILMFLAFMIDQLEESFCELFQAARTIKRTKYSLWEKIRSLFDMFNIDNWTELILGVMKKSFGALPDTNTS